MHDRIRELRKKHLHLSQSAFGERLGVSRSVINNIELNALARPDQKLSLIKLMCKEFSVNEDWLLYGNEPMFVQPDSFSLDHFAKEHGCTELELEILKAYFELNQEIRLAVVNHFKERLTSAKEQAASDCSPNSPAVPTIAVLPLLDPQPEPESEDVVDNDQLLDILSKDPADMTDEECALYGKAVRLQSILEKKAEETAAASQKGTMQQRRA